MRNILLVLFIFYSLDMIPEDRIYKPNQKVLEEFNSIINDWKKEEIKKIESLKFASFLDDLSKRESSMNPKSVNTEGYIGEFQFGQAALKQVGLEHITVEKFIENPNIFPKKLQRKAIKELMKSNYSIIEDLANKYIGKKIKGIKITESGLIAAMHLAGAGGVQKFLQTNGGHDPQDVYGTKLSDYLKKFNNHELNLTIL